MMGGGAFILLKVGRIGPESSEYAEIRIANLWKILRICGFGAGTDSQKRAKMADGPGFRGIWLI
jgi:hypothetical protein